MNFTKSILALIWLAAFFSCSNQTSIAQIQIRIPTIEQEATSIWRTINDIEFLEQQGYRIHLPDHDVIQSLMAKSKAKQFGNEDFATIYNALESGIYDKRKYDAALKKVQAQEALINTLIKRIKSEKESWDWPFQTFEPYDVVFTLYGTGGSYNPENGQVTLFTNEEGKFMNYENPINTIMHEIVHMGIEQSIVQNYQLPHGLKERIVDKITYLLFVDKIPDYKIQNMGDPKIDAYLTDKKDLKRLSSNIERYQSEQ
ncbi:MAG: hypothetical protein AAFP19_23860 [Bacteroidota bacterium]